MNPLSHPPVGPSQPAPGRPPTARRPGPVAFETALRRAAALGAAAARADATNPRSAGDPLVYARWRRLRRRHDRQTRQLLRVAFDTGYGQAVHAATKV